MRENGITIIGLEDVQKVLDTVAPNEARNLARATIHGIASDVAKKARANAPKDTGRLKKSIKAKRKRSSPEKPISDVIVTNPKGSDWAFYWRFVEYGTSGKTSTAARPFIGPAALEAKTNFNKVFKEQFFKKLAARLKRASKKQNKI